MNEERKHVFEWLLLCFTGAFMMCLFAPLDAFFANRDEYWFSLGQILPIILVVFVCEFAICAVVALLLNRTKISPYVFAALLCVLLFFYVQGNYIPRNYGVLNGADIEWSHYTTLGVASIVLAVVCIVLCVVLIIRLKKEVFQIGKYVCLFLLAIQLITLGTTFVQKELTAEKETKHQPVVTDKNLLDLSENRTNIVVFLLDTFDGTDMRYLLEEDFDLYADIFQGFTYYPDTLGTFPTTKGAVPYLLSGVRYDNSIPFTQYIDSAFQDNTLAEAFKKNGYNLDVYTLGRFMSMEPDTYRNTFSGRYNVHDYPGFAQTLYRLVAFNYMPHQAKRFFTVDTDSFLDFRESPIAGYGAFSEDVQAFNNLLREEGFKATDSGNVFKFIHLDGIHMPYTFGADLTTVEGENYSSFTEAAGNCTMLKTAFDEMKALGVYDSSAIIVMGDHGHYSYSQNPIFLIKNPGERHEFLVSDTKMSYDYMQDVFMALINGEDANECILADAQASDGARRFYYYRWNSDWDRDYLPDIYEMKTEGFAWDESAMEFTGRKYIAGDDSFDYEIGTTLSFGKEGSNANAYIGIGFAGTEENGTWTNGHEASLCFKLNGLYEDLKVDIFARPYHHDQHVTVQVNDTAVGELLFQYPGDQTRSVIIPGELVDGDMLELRFQLSDAVRPVDVEEKNKDSRTLGIHVYNLTVSSVPKGAALNGADADAEKDADETVEARAENKTQETSLALEYNPYQLGTQVVMRGENASPSFVAPGFSHIEPNHRWTERNEAVIPLSIEEPFQNLEFTMQYMTIDDQQSAKVYANDTLIYEGRLTKGTLGPLFIPGEAVTDGRLLLRFELPNAVSPAELGMNQDQRKLALSLESFEVSAAKAEG